MQLHVAYVNPVTGGFIEHLGVSLLLLSVTA